MFSIIYISATCFSILLLLESRLNFIIKSLLVALIFGLVALMMTPKAGVFTDTVRFFDELNNIRLNIRLSSFTNALKQLLSSSSISANDSIESYSSIPVMGIIMMIMSNFGNGWLLFLVAFVDIFCALWIIHKFSQRYLREGASEFSFSKYEMYAWVSFLCLFNFNAAIGGIRNNLVGFVYILVLIELFANTGKTVKILILQTITAIILVLIHPFALVLYIISLLAILCYKNRLLMFACEIVLLLQRFYQSLVIGNLQIFGGSSVVQNMMFKNSQYFGANSYIGAASQFSVVRDGLRFLLFIMIIICVRMISTNNSDIMNRYNGFINLYIAYSLGATYDATLFNRCISLMLIAVIPYLVQFFYFLCSKEQIKFKHPILMYGFTGLLSIFLVLSLVDNVRAGTRFYDMTFNNLLISLSFWRDLL